MPLVTAGDLVKVRIKRKDGESIEIYYREQAKEVEAWLWTGTEGRADPKHMAAQDGPWGSLGSRTVRAALVGRAIHERLEVSVDRRVGGGFVIPQKGFITRRELTMIDGGGTSRGKVERISLC